MSAVTEYHVNQEQSAVVQQSLSTGAIGSAQPLRTAAAAVIALLLMTACSHLRPTQTAPTTGDWHEFQGTWTATGSRNIIRLEGERRASVATFEGSLVLAGPSRPGFGFRSEAIIFNDSSTGLVGRAVWTDERGDRIFSELRGEGTATNNRIIGTFAGGTGRYSGATGAYEFSWRFLLENEEGTVQGQSSGLTGRVRVDSTRAKAELGERL